MGFMPGSDSRNGKAILGQDLNIADRLAMLTLQRYTNYSQSRTNGSTIEREIVLLAKP